MRIAVGLVDYSLGLFRRYVSLWFSVCLARLGSGSRLRRNLEQLSFEVEFYLSYISKQTLQVKLYFSQHQQHIQTVYVQQIYSTPQTCHPTVFSSFTSVSQSFIWVSILQVLLSWFWIDCQACRWWPTAERLTTHPPQTPPRDCTSSRAVAERYLQYVGFPGAKTASHVLLSGSSLLQFKAGLIVIKLVERIWWSWRLSSRAECLLCTVCTSQYISSRTEPPFIRKQTNVRLCEGREVRWRVWNCTDHVLVSKDLHPSHLQSLINPFVIDKDSHSPVHPLDFSATFVIVGHPLASRPQHLLRGVESEVSKNDGRLRVTWWSSIFTIWISLVLGQVLEAVRLKSMPRWLNVI